MSQATRSVRCANCQDSQDQELPWPRHIQHSMMDRTRHLAGMEQQEQQDDQRTQYGLQIRCSMIDSLIITLPCVTLLTAPDLSFLESWEVLLAGHCLEAP